MQDSLVILDFDAHCASMATRILRGQQVFCRLLPGDTSAADVAALAPKGVILVSQNGADVDLSRLDDGVLTLGVPVLALGALTEALCIREGGTSMAPTNPQTMVRFSTGCDELLSGMEQGERVMHGLNYLTLPPTLTPIATASEKVIGFRSATLPIYAIEYPIERNDPDGIQLLENFATRICGAQALWDDEHIIGEAVERIAATAGDGLVLCAVSGGVDSAVAAKLAHQAVGDRLMCVLIDTGLFRDGECEHIIMSYMETMGLVVAYVDAKDAFVRALSGVKSDRDKERIATELLMQMLLKQIEFAGDVRTVVRGTNFNDTLYGVKGDKDISSTLREKQLLVLEPLRDLFKNEVRQLARTLGLPASITERQPFPSSGLARRVVGELSEEKLNILRQADAIFMEEICAAGHERKLWQYYATLYENPEQAGLIVVLRASQASRHSAYAARLPYDVLERTVERILDAIPQVQRVIYDLTPSRHYEQME